VVRQRGLGCRVSVCHVRVCAWGIRRDVWHTAWRWQL